MPFEVKFSSSAEIDLGYYKAFQQRIIIDGVRLHLLADADKPSKRRKKLGENPLAPWELRLGDYRAFYEVEDDAHVKVVAVGHKEHNDLYIRGEKVQL